MSFVALGRSRLTGHFFQWHSTLLSETKGANRGVFQIHLSSAATDDTILPSANACTAYERIDLT